MLYNYDKNLTHLSQRLRKEMTKEEKHLWYDFLKKLPITVNRQKIIGGFIVDFFIAEKRIVIEIDGSQHYEEEHSKADKERDSELFALGITVLRYTNSDINKKNEKAEKLASKRDTQSAPRPINIFLDQWMVEDLWITTLHIGPYSMGRIRC